MKTIANLTLIFISYWLFPGYLYNTGSKVRLFYARAWIHINFRRHLRNRFAVHSICSQRIKTTEAHSADFIDSQYCFSTVPSPNNTGENIQVLIFWNVHLMIFSIAVWYPFHPQVSAAISHRSTLSPLATTRAPLASSETTNPHQPRGETPPKHRRSGERDKKVHRWGSAATPEGSQPGRKRRRNRTDHGGR